MQRHLLRIAIALLAFSLGIGATLLWVTLREPSVRDMGMDELRLVTLAPAGSTGDQRDAPPPPRATPWEAGCSKLDVGILDEKASEKPAPQYPPLARSAYLMSVVVVRVCVDAQNGRVIAAQAISGHPLFREAAEHAAKQARFTPAKIDGPPVRVSGLLTYRFGTE